MMTFVSRDFQSTKKINSSKSSNYSRMKKKTIWKCFHLMKITKSKQFHSFDIRFWPLPKFEWPTFRKQSSMLQIRNKGHTPIQPLHTHIRISFLFQKQQTKDTKNLNSNSAEEGKPIIIRQSRPP